MSHDKINIQITPFIYNYKPEDGEDHSLYVNMKDKYVSGNFADVLQEP